MITVRETLYAIYCGGRFVAAYTTMQQAATVAAGIKGICQIVPMTGKRREES